MPTAPSPLSSRRSRVDVRALTLAQLQKLAERGSRRAHAELEGRMRAAVAAAPPAVALPASAPEPEPVPVPRPPARQVPTLTARVTAASLAPPSQGAADAAPRDALVQQLELIARQDEQRARADGAPRLVGMALIGWGLLLLLGALVMLARGGGAYYLFCALGAAAVGALLMRRSRWAMALQALLVLLALAWAWSATRGSAFTLLVQAAPAWMAALWLAAPAVREPLE